MKRFLLWLVGVVLGVGIFLGAVMGVSYASVSYTHLDVYKRQALCEGGAARNLLAMASSHFCAAERQFRTPLSYGAVRTPTAQWTAPAAGCCLLQPQGEGVGIAAATFGSLQDYQVKDINNMGCLLYTSGRRCWSQCPCRRLGYRSRRWMPSCRDPSCVLHGRC